MNKTASNSIKSRLFASKVIFKAVGILLILILISMWIVCGMLAKYTDANSNITSARVARMAMVELHEHKAELQNGIYVLDTDTIVGSNEYDTVLPGVDIPKDAFIQSDGKNEVACALYIEVVNVNVPDEVSYTIGTSFETETSIVPSHGGTLYKYNQTIQPGTDRPITHIFSDNKLRVSDTFKDRSVAEKNTAPFKIEIYAYLVQID